MKTFSPLWYEAKEKVNDKGKTVWFHGFNAIIDGEEWNFDLWFLDEEIKDLEMSFAAQYVLQHYLAIGQFNQMLYGGIADGEKMVFTQMPEF